VYFLYKKIFFFSVCENVATSVAKFLHKGVSFTIF